MTAPARYLLGDVSACLDRLDDGEVDVVVTSVPYWGRRRYLPGDDREIGTEPLHVYLDRLAVVFDRIVGKLADDGLVWLNVGDTAVGSGGSGGDYSDGGSYADRDRYRQAEATVWQVDAGALGGATLGRLRPGQWAGVPHRLAAELQRHGWLLRSSIVWAKPTPRREDVRHVRRPKEQHETVLLLSKQPAGATRFSSTDQRLGDVWEISAARGNEAVGKAPWPVALPAKMLGLSGPAGLVLDPFAGAGNSAIAARRAGWRFVGIDLDPEAVRIAESRTPVSVEVVDGAVADVDAAVR